MATEVERITKLETEMADMMDFKKDHLQLHKDEVKEKGNKNQNWTTNILATAVLLMSILTYFEAKSSKSETPKHQPPGIERTMQGEVRP